MSNVILLRITLCISFFMCLYLELFIIRGVVSPEHYIGVIGYGIRLCGALFLILMVLVKYLAKIVHKNQEKYLDSDDLGGIINSEKLSKSNYTMSIVVTARFFSSILFGFVIASIATAVITKTFSLAY